MRHLVLSEETSRHVVQVLRMQAGELVRLTDGVGNLYDADISEAHKKKCSVNIRGIETIPAPAQKNCIAISPLKNNNRFEWFLEKTTELGVTDIIPVICSRTEKSHIRNDRLKGILISAMLQSQQAWLPVLHEPVPFKALIQQSGFSTKLIAHCEEGKPRTNITQMERPGDNIILIGPEGDFTNDEIDAAIKQGFVPVSLGDNRLRTETAGVAAAVVFQMVKN